MYDSWARERRRQIEEQEALAAQLLRQVSILQLAIAVESLCFPTLFPLWRSKAEYFASDVFDHSCCDADRQTLILNAHQNYQQTKLQHTCCAPAGL